MKQTKFSKDYAFVYYQFEKYRYTDAREGSSRHFLAVLEAGRARVVAQDQVLELKAGDSFYIPLGMAYQSYWQGRQIHFRSYGFDHFPDAATQSFRLQKLPREATDLIRQIPIDDKNPKAETLGIFYTVLGQLVKVMQTVPAHSTAQLLERARGFLYGQPNCKMQELAEHCCVSQSALYSLFRRHLNMTPNTLRQQVNTEKAVALLSTTDIPVQQISDSLGFSSASYFRKILKAQTGKTPSQIRKEARSV